LIRSGQQTIVLIGDVHDEIERLARTLALVDDCRADLALLVGDIGEDPPWHRALRRTRRAEHDESIRRVIAHVRSACECSVVFVPGNHDLDDPPGDVDGINADRRIVEVGGLRIAGLGGAGPTPFGFPYEWSEDEAEAALDRLLGDAGAVDVFLSHSPPSDTKLDRTAHGAFVGSTAVKRWISRVRPKLFVCGHIHEAWGVEWREGVPCVNTGALGEPYARDIAWIVDWCDGPERIRSLCRDENGQPEQRIWEAP
jgi:Icc-related predicted phosphoesterase